ncbi:MAG: hypothetical protein ACLTZI_13400 [[Eubacterium] siraeum]
MKRILCFGDSNTWGLIPGTDKRFADGVRWTSIIRNDLEQSGYEIIEEGLCGRTTVFEDPDRIGRAGDKLLPVFLGKPRSAGYGHYNARNERLQAGL